MDELRDVSSFRRRETCWRVVVGPDGYMLSCGIYDTHTPAVELRVSSSANQRLHSQLLSDTESARALAQQWLELARASGGLTALPYG